MVDDFACSRVLGCFWLFVSNCVLTAVLKSQVIFNHLHSLRVGIYIVGPGHPFYSSIINLPQCGCPCAMFNTQRWQHSGSLSRFLQKKQNTTVSIGGRNRVMMILMFHEKMHNMGGAQGWQSGRRRWCLWRVYSLLGGFLVPWGR